MNRITVSKSDCKQETTSAWLASILQFCIDGGLLTPFKAFKLNMKEVRYTIYQKLLTVMSSIMMGCESTKDINEVLGPETLAANMLDMDRFPDQSQINVFLSRMDLESVSQLKNIHHELFMKYSHSLSSLYDVVVDIDQSGLVANSKTYEFADKGYFSHKRGKRGYQVSAAFTGKYSETVDFYFDSGNMHCQDRLMDLLNDVGDNYKVFQSLNFFDRITLIKLQHMLLPPIISFVVNDRLQYFAGVFHSQFLPVTKLSQRVKLDKVIFMDISFLLKLYTCYLLQNKISSVSYWAKKLITTKMIITALKTKILDL